MNETLRHRVLKNLCGFSFDYVSFWCFVFTVSVLASLPLQPLRNTLDVPLIVFISYHAYVVTGLSGMFESIAELHFFQALVRLGFVVMLLGIFVVFRSTLRQIITWCLGDPEWAAD